ATRPCAARHNERPAWRASPPTDFSDGCCELCEITRTHAFTLSSCDLRKLRTCHSFGLRAEPRHCAKQDGLGRPPEGAATRSELKFQNGSAVLAGPTFSRGIFMAQGKPFARPHSRSHLAWNVLGCSHGLQPYRTGARISACKRWQLPFHPRHQE